MKPNTITRQQQKLYHAIIRDIHNAKKDLIVSLEGKIAPIPVYALAIEPMRLMLKCLDLDYPKDKKGEPAGTSYGQISTTDMGNHIRWLEQAALESHIGLKHYEEEMRRQQNSYIRETFFNG